MSDSEDYARVATAIRYLDQHRQEQPELADLADHVGLSPAYLQRTFKRWAGVSPKRFLQFLTLEHARQLLLDSETVLETSFEVGLSGPSRLHDLLVTAEAITPGEVRRRGAGLTVRWGVHASPFGRALLGATPRGLCWLGFVDDDPAATLADLRTGWERATLIEDPAATAAMARDAFADLRRDPLRLHLRGTSFQLQVWRALLEIPPGAVVSYGALAQRLERPKAARATGSAVARNPISFLIPCHRVIRETGAFHRYRWGRVRKHAMLSREAGRRVSAEATGPAGLRSD